MSDLHQMSIKMMDIENQWMSFIEVAAKRWRCGAQKKGLEAEEVEGVAGVEGEVWERAWMISLVHSSEEEERRAEIDMLVVMRLIVWSESCGKQEGSWGSVMRTDLSPSIITDGTTGAHRFSTHGDE